jgi:transposase
MKIMVGIDLHSNNAVCGLMDMKGKRLLHKRVPCDLKQILGVLKPYQERIDTVAVESTYNWYWLVDGLQAQKYNTVLANPAAIDQYKGLKHADDTSDAFFLAEMSRLGILPRGYIYDRKTRATRDLLRRRLGLVRKRTSLYVSFKSLYTRTTGLSLRLTDLKKLSVADAVELFKHPSDRLIAGELIELIERLTRSIGTIEQTVLKTALKTPYYRRLQSIPGIGMILGLTITMEVGDIKRFPTPGDFASYCRCVRSQRLTNHRRKGKNNDKCGNPYLGWAFIEASNISRRFDLLCRRFYDRKAKQTNSILATKALACKLAKAAWHVMHHKKDFDSERVFGSAPQKTLSAERSVKPLKGVGVKPSD